MRKYFVTTSILTTILTFGITYAAEPTTQRVESAEYGGTGGAPFKRVDVKEIKLRHGSVVDALLLNGIQHGGSGGKPSTGLKLRENEYISEVEIRYGNVVDRLAFKTNLGGSISGGGHGGRAVLLKNIRVLKIGGRSGNLLDAIEIQYVKNYKPSLAVPGGKANFIIDIRPPSSKYESYKQERYESINTYTKVSQIGVKANISSTVSAGVEAEYFAKMSRTIGVSFENTTTETVHEESKKLLDRKETVTHTVGAKEVAVQIISGQIMQAPDGKFWMQPNGKPQWIKFDIDGERGTSQYKNLNGVFDLTDKLHIQIASLEPKREKGWARY